MSWIEKNVDPDIANYLFTIRTKMLNGVVHQKNVIPDLDIDFEMLEEQLQDTPQMIAFWNQLLAEQTCLCEILDRRIKTKRGQIWDTIVSDAQSRNVDIRSTDIKEIINTDQTISQLEIELFREKRKETKLKTVVDALSKKFDALRSLSGFKREEKRSV